MTAPLRPSQVEGVDFLSTRSRAILADDAGLGKSVQSIRAADGVGAARVLVLCQAIGRVSWAIEFPKWQQIDRQVIIYDKNTKVIPPTGPVAVIAAYPTLSRATDRERFKRMLFRAMVFHPFDVVIIDEGQHLSHPKSLRTKAVYGSTMDITGGVLDIVEATRVWVLSATLQRNNASELFPHMRALFPAVLAHLFGYVPTYKDFVSRFCNEAVTPYGKQIVGNNQEAVAQLREAMRPFILRRVKRDVAAELGAIQSITLPLPVDPKEVLELARGSGEAEMDEWLDLLDDYPDPAGITLNPPPNASAQWRALGLLKIDPAVEWIEDFLSTYPDKKLIVFAHHRDVIDALHQRLAHYLPAVIHGGVLTERRVVEANAFQNDPKARLFIGQTIAAGTSITLTAASTVLQLEPEWVPADNYQAVSRAHRIGQTEPVTVYYGFAAGTVDERIAARAKRKADDFSNLFDPLTSAA
jgi:SWI/SNF-related matrix-associated actin-dependent regulator of chromatin subfamily A-like protein 1